MILALTLAVAIGFSLTVLGSGGSIITLPVLVYAADVPPQSAVGMSLAVVGGTSLAATLLNARSGLVHAKAAALFSATGIVGALAGAQLTHLVSPALLMLLFAALMIVIATLMLHGGNIHASDSTKQCHWQRCSLAGLGVGALTAFLGVGGGFLITAGMFLGTSLIGMLAGRLVARRLAVAQLRVAFAWFVLAVGAFVIAKNWSYFF